MSKVLIVEDDPMVALINRRYLERVGGMEIYGPLALEEEILALLEKEPIDLILLDVYLPQKDGLSLLERIRQNQHFMDVIMITAANAPDEVKKAYAYGVIDYLVKPFEYERFEKAIEKHRKRQQLLAPNNALNQEDIDREVMAGAKEIVTIQIEEELPKGLNRHTLEKVIDCLRKDNPAVDLQEEGRESSLGESECKVWTLRELAKAINVSNVTIKKYMDYLEVRQMVYVNLTSGQVGRPEYNYRIK